MGQSYPNAQGSSGDQGPFSGQQLGNYRLTKLLGRGGFADVYLGQHKRLNTYAAVKVMHAHLSQEEMEGFEKEAQTIANLKHPSIVRILDFDVAGNIPFLVMDHAPHGTLRQRHPRGSPLPLATVASYVKQVAGALQHAHDQKLIHRDVKPENMLIGSSQEILLSDFGIAVVAHSTRSQRVETVIGTWTYAAPEQFAGTLRPAADQYALAIVVYEWLCGAPPFEGTFPELYHQHMNVLPPSLRSKLATIPDAVEQVLLRALAKDAHQRFPSVQEFAIALEAASQPSAQPPLPPTQLAPAVQSASQIPNQAEQMVPCSTCGKSTLANSTFCAHCGTRTAASGPERIEAPASPPLPISAPLSPTELSAGTPLLTYRGHSKAVYAVTWSPDGRLLASASSDETIHTWQASNGKLLLIYRGHSSYVTAVAWSPDGHLLASASLDKTVQVWQASSGQQLQTYCGHSAWVAAVAWSHDSRLIASAGWDKTVQVWNTSDGKLLLTYRSDAVKTVAWSHDGRLLASAGEGNTVHVWDVSTGKRLSTYSGHSAHVNVVAWSHDGRLIASASQDKTVQVWNTSDGKLLQTYHGHSDVVTALAWSSNGHLLASAGWDKTVQVWLAV